MNPRGHFQVAILLLIVLVALTTGCGGSDEGDTPGPDVPDVVTAPLVYAQRMANADRAASPAAARASTHVGRIIDTRHARLTIEVAQGTVRDGQADPCDWIQIYDSQEEMRDGDRVFAPIDLPVGDYDNLRISTDADRVVWECSFAGGMVDIPVQTSNSMVFGDGGLFHYLDGSETLVSVAPGERLGGFEIRAGFATHLTFVSNLDSLNWHDADDSGDWSDGDRVDGVTGVPGTQTMGDFVTSHVPLD